MPSHYGYEHGKKYKKKYGKKYKKKYGKKYMKNHGDEYGKKYMGSKKMKRDPFEGAIAVKTKKTKWG